MIQPSCRTGGAAGVPRNTGFLLETGMGECWFWGIPSFRREGTRSASGRNIWVVVVTITWSPCWMHSCISCIRSVVFPPAPTAAMVRGEAFPEASGQGYWERFSTVSRQVSSGKRFRLQILWVQLLEWCSEKAVSHFCCRNGSSLWENSVASCQTWLEKNK